MCQRCRMASVTTSIQPKMQHATSRFRRRLGHHPPEKVHYSSEKNFQVNGVTCLCFPEDHFWFRGTISTVEGDDYSIQGQLVIMTSQEKAEAAARLADNVRKLSFTDSDEENNNVNDSHENSDKVTEPSRYYQVILTDHHTAMSQKLPRIYLKDSSEHLYESENGEVSFKTEKVFKGQRAELEMR